MRKLWMWILCIGTILLCGCTTQSSTSDTTPAASVPGAAQQLDAQTIIFSENTSLNSTVYSQQSQYAEIEGELFLARSCGDAVLSGYRFYDAAQEACAYTILWGENQVLIPAETQFFIQYLWGSSDGLWGIYTLDENVHVGKWNWNGTLLCNQSIDEISNPCDLLYSEGLYLLTDSELLLLSEELQILERVSFEQSISAPQLATDGENVYCHYDDQLKSYASGTLVENYHCGLPVEYRICSAKDRLYCVDAQALWSIDVESKAGAELLRWENADITEPENFVGQSEQGYQVFWYNTFTGQYELVTLVERSGQEEKQTLVLATTESLDSSDFEAAIQYFNLHNSQYQVEILAYDGEADLENREQQLKLDVLAGKQIDMILFSNLDSYPFIARGYLEDLYPWMEGDPEVGEISASVLAANTLDGALYTCVAEYDIATFVGATSVVGNGDQWTLSDFAAVLETVDLAEVTPISGMSSYDFLNYYCVYNLSHFVDRAAGTCQFDCEEFRLLLELCQDAFPQTARTGSVLDGTAVLEPLQEISSFATYADDTKKYEGVAVTQIGFPGAAGNGGIVTTGFVNVGMISTSGCKDGVWEFLKFLWSMEYQSSQVTFSCPALVLAMDNLLNKRITQYSTITEEQAAAIRTFYLGAKSGASWSSEIPSMVLEETQAFLAGDKSLEDTIAVIQNRVNIYLSEQS